MGKGNNGYGSGEVSHRALRTIQQELRRHPIVTDVRGFPSGEFTRVTADLATERWGVERENASLEIRWFAGETVEASPEFSFHYSDDAGDFGWHHDPNPHVEGWGHFQESCTDAAEYSYEPHSFSSENPARLVWEIMSLLSSRLGADA
jgi:hypothetical protein